MKPAAPVLLLMFAAWTCGPVAAVPVEADFVNASRVTRCAEEDNVYIKVLGPRIATFRISAEHPPYIARVRKDSTAPDFTACDMSKDPSFTFTPRKVVLYEDARIRLVGHTFATFWRPDAASFRVGDRIESGLHLVQLVRRRQKGDIEILVVYPGDGYWRAKPLPPRTMPDTAYGSSFLFGPVEEDGRPYVAIRSIAFDPTALTFSIVFRNDTRGVLRVAAAGSARTRLALTLDTPPPAGQPFAALRSMYVSTAQADVAMASWPAAAATRGQATIMEFTRVTAPSARFGRIEPSRHNLSAPDHVFDRFDTVLPPAAPLSRRR